MKLTFLEAEVPLTKTFSLENGEIQKIGHPKLVDCTSHHYDVQDLKGFCDKLQHHAALGHCLLKGNTTRELVSESRAGTTNPNSPTEWACFDLDGLKHILTVDDFMGTIGLPDVSYIAQYSASMGVLPSRGLSAHVLVMLDREHLPDALKQYLKMKNFSVPGLRAGLSLTRTGNALRWTLDVTTCQNDKLIYIAPPLLENGVVDSFKGDRIQLVLKEKPRATLSDAVNTEQNRLNEQRELDRLREAAGLEKKKWDRSKTVHGVTYMPKPDASTMTGIKEERGYVYLNLNGGDSWGYYHKKDNPEFIYNFKGEPPYRTSELLPDYWASVQRERRRELKADDLVYLAFRDFKSSVFYNGTWDAQKGELKIAAANGEQQIRDYLTEHGQPQPEVIPTYSMVYEPLTTERVDLAGKWINMYQPTELELRYAREPEVVAEMPEPAKYVFMHALNNDPVMYDHFVNWNACVLQFKESTQTCWVIHGIEGTGKGLIFNEFLKYFLGENAIETRMEVFASEFNGFLDHKVLVLVDEGEMEAQQRARILESNFKNYITEPRVMVRHMRQLARSEPSHLNFIITSNNSAVMISGSDRRYNVAQYQATPMPKPNEPGSPFTMQQIRDSRWHTYCYLMGLKADRERARSALWNDAKAQLSELSKNSIQAACDAFKKGDYDFFVSQIKDDITGLTTKEQEQAIAYKALVTAMKAYDCLSREEAFLLVNSIVGDLSPAPAKFTKLLAHNRLTVSPMKRGGKQFRGFRVSWRQT